MLRISVTRQQLQSGRIPILFINFQGILSQPVQDVSEFQLQVVCVDSCFVDVGVAESFRFKLKPAVVWFNFWRVHVTEWYQVFKKS